MITPDDPLQLLHTPAKAVEIGVKLIAVPAIAILAGVVIPALIAHAGDVFYRESFLKKPLPAAAETAIAESEARKAQLRSRIELIKRTFTAPLAEKEAAAAVPALMNELDALEAKLKDERPDVSLALSILSQRHHADLGDSVYPVPDGWQFSSIPQT